MHALVLCLDISESMACGQPSKLKQALEAIRTTVQSLDQDAHVALVTFDATAEVLFSLQPSNLERIEDALNLIVPRGVTCIAAGLTEASNLIKKSAEKGEVLLLTDGRANLSWNRMGGFEGSLNLEDELLGVAKEASQENVAIHAVAVGEDAYTHTLSTISKKSRGHFWVAEDFRGLAGEPQPAPKAILSKELRVHGAPAELPSAQPTWTKESQLMHVIVVSQSLTKTYEAHRRAFLVNPVNGREARTALISIESDILTGYRHRRPKTAENVKADEAVLLDRSYRDYLALGDDARVKLGIY